MLYRGKKFQFVITIHPEILILLRKDGK